MDNTFIPPLSDPWGSPQDLQSVPTMLRRNQIGTAKLVGQQTAWMFDPSRFVEPIEASVIVTAAMGAPIIQRSDTPRNWLFFRNTDATNIIFIGFGGPASALSPLSINPGERILLDFGVPQSDVWAFAAAGNPVLAYGFGSMGFNP